MKVVNVSDEAHAAAKAAAEHAGMSLGAWASERLIEAAYGPLDPTLTAIVGLSADPLTTDNAERIAQMALERSQTPSEALSAALDALARPRDWRAEKPLPVSHEQLAEEYRVKIVDSCYDGDMEVIDEEGVEDLLREMLARVPFGIQPPKPRPEPDCRCDGPEEPGPHHKPSCGRRT